MAPSDFEIEAKTLQEDGKVVAVGFFVTDDDSSPFVVVRLHPDGSLDPSFHGCGIVTTKVGSCDDHAASVEVQADGKILVVGTSYHFGRTSAVTVLRYDFDGNLDRSFGDQGVVQVKLSGGYDQGHSLVIQDDGTILVVAEADSGCPQWGFLRLRADGERIVSFGAPASAMAS